MKKAGLGLIGLGFIGSVHLRHSLRLSDASVVAVSDLSKKALKSARDAGVRKVFTDYEQLLRDPDVDAVVISLPTHLHLQCARKAAEAKKHIFLEKPIARNVPEARGIVLSARRNHVKLMIGYPLRFNPEFVKLREEIKSRALGDVEIAHATYVSSGPFFHRAEGYAPVPVPEWWFSKELTGGGALMDMGSHIINLLRWYFGEITDIRGRFGYRFNLDFEDHATCLARFDSGTDGVISVGWFSQGYQLKVELLGSVRNAIAEHLPSNPLLTVAQMLTTGVSKFYWPHFAELQYFVKCVRDDLRPFPSGEDGLKDVEAIARAYESKIQAV